MCQQQYTAMRRLHDRGPMPNLTMGTEERTGGDLEDAMFPRAKRRTHAFRRSFVVVPSMLFFLLMVLLFLQPHPTSGSLRLGKATISPDFVFFNPGLSRDQPILQLWGQYSPYYPVDSDHAIAIPPGCRTNFAQILSRHGARYPTSSKSAMYGDLVTKIKHNVKVFRGRYRFMKGYQYDLGADDLIDFGRQEMIDSGAQFYSRYAHLVDKLPMFVRASGQDRVVESAQLFVKGYNAAHASAASDIHRKRPKKKTPHGIVDPKDIVIVPEGPQYNNTLDHSQCTAFESSVPQTVAAAVPNTFLAEFVPPIRIRLNNDLSGANLTTTDVISLMDLCPFTTLASFDGIGLSSFCGLFTKDEWAAYNHFQTLQKYYGFGAGAGLGPTQGVGWVNELVARLTSSPVKDHTNVNHTLDADPETFPIDRALYADFSHDNDMTSIFSALGLWNSTKGLEGFEAGEVVPFAARGWIEKMTCGSQQEFVRVIINNRVMQLPQCESNEFGLCSLTSFISSLVFARQGGKWKECYK